jgi:hypothetical protein
MTTTHTAAGPAAPGRHRAILILILTVLGSLPAACHKSPTAVTELNAARMHASPPCGRAARPADR